MIYSWWCLPSCCTVGTATASWRCTIFPLHGFGTVFFRIGTLDRGLWNRIFLWMWLTLLPQIMSPESGYWDNNHLCVIFGKSKVTKWRPFSIKMVLDENSVIFSKNSCEMVQCHNFRYSESQNCLKYLRLIWFFFENNWEVFSILCGLLWISEM